MNLKRYLFALLLFIGLLPMAMAQQAAIDSTIFYKVKQAENLYRLSLKFNCSVQQIKDWNKLNNEDYVQAGQVLKIIVLPIPTVPSVSLLNTNTAVAKQKNDSVDLKIKHFIDSIKMANAMLPIDTIESKSILLKNNGEKEVDLAFEGTRITERDEHYDSTGKITLSGYVSAYYAYYTDSVGLGKYENFPTSAPISNAFSLNMLMISAKYSSTKLRGTFTLHYGDIPSSAWSSQYNLIQEANIGFKIVKGIWFDAGFFRTHLGVESIQPRENITSSISTVTYYEPYYLSGAKLTFHLSSKFSVQVNAFNGFNTFIETNNTKAFGFSAVYDATDKLSFNFNSLYCDESPDNQLRKQDRLYNNFYFTYKSKRFDLAGEVNYGIQKNSLLSDTTATANILSTLLVARLRLNKKLSIYSRGEYFKDQNEILTGPVLNEFHKLVGLNLWGVTAGLEVKPIANSYLRFEWRQIQTQDDDEKVFYYNQSYHNQRNEFIAALGFWF